MAGKRYHSGRNGFDFDHSGSVSLGADANSVISINGVVELNDVPLVTDIVQNILLNVAVDSHIFIPPVACQLHSFKVIYTAAQGGAATLDLKKCATATAPASGTTMLAAAVNLNTTVNTQIAATLSATPANLLLATTDTAALDWSTTIGSLAGAVATIVWRPV